MTEQLLTTKEVPTQDVLLTAKEVAGRLKVHVATVRREIQRGNLPAVRIGQDGRLARIKESDLQAYIEKNLSTAA